MISQQYKTWPIPTDHCRQVTAATCVAQVLEQGRHSITHAMDLGCGAGDSVDLFRRLNPNINWVGLDIESSPEVGQRQRQDATFATFDGIHIPFADHHFDLIFTNQALEHVTHPRPLLLDVQRVLRPGGYLVGSTSQLEPYHSFSTWNYTPYGFQLLVEEAGFELVEMRPSIDALTLILRSGLGKPKVLSRYWEHESPLNQVINLWGKVSKQSIQTINLKKLLFCGQFCFVAQKP
jgi:ubiquinone/menaquinone biosynthesis C-methylase UbiE